LQTGSTSDAEHILWFKEYKIFINLKSYNNIIRAL
jgi:hypothetical protein